MKGNLSVISWNVKGLNHPVKKNKVFTHLKQLKPGVVFLHDSDQWRLDKCWAGQFFHSNFRGKARRTAILINRNIPFEPSDVIPVKNGRFIIVSAKLYDKSLTLANVYAPNVDDVQFFNSFFFPNSHSLILGGDFNCCLDAVLDYSSSKATTLSKSAGYIKSFLADISLSDPWRFLYPTGREYLFFPTSITPIPK